MKGRNLLPTKRLIERVTSKALTLLLGMGLLSSSLSSCHSTKAQPVVNVVPDDPNTSPEPNIVLERIHKYLVKNPVLYDQLSWDEKGISIYPRPSAKDSGLAEVTVPWEMSDRFLCVVQNDKEGNLDNYLNWNALMPKEDCEPLTHLAQFLPIKTYPLNGLMIAIDPGHVGGTMEFASMEKKFVRIQKGNRPEIQEMISFNEGNLALGTAIMLKDTLEKLGAFVKLTRSKEGHTAFDITFAEWLERETRKAEKASGKNWSRLKGKTIEGYPLRLRNGAAWNWVQQEGIKGKDSLWWMTESTMRDIYRIPFLKADFQRRAEKINGFNPHLTLILHYNVWEKNTWSSGKFLNAINDNYAMTFIPGSFMAGELNDPEERLAFLKKAFSDDLARSERLSSLVVEGFEKHLGVPAIPYDTSLRYLRAASLPTDQRGVFARNLSLTRLIDGPLCFGEALYQDNYEECLRLNEKKILLPGMKTRLPRRLHDVVNAYLHGVMAYAKER